jgi:conjugal transfer/entry exclusion protein
VLVCASAGPAWGQLLVLDPAVVAQTTATVSHLYTVIRMMTQDLAAFTQLGVVVQLLQQVASIEQEISGLAAELTLLSQGWSQLQTSAVGLCQAEMLRGWKGQAVQWNRRAESHALSAQSLLARSTGLLQTLLALIGSIERLTGTTSGLQSTSALMGVTVTQLEQLKQVLTPPHMAAMGRSLTDSVVAEASLCLQQQRFRDWGTYTRGIP